MAAECCWVFFHYSHKFVLDVLMLLLHDISFYALQIYKANLKLWSKIFYGPTHHACIFTHEQLAYFPFPKLSTFKVDNLSENHWKKENQDCFFQDRVHCIICFILKFPLISEVDLVKYHVTFTWNVSICCIWSSFIWLFCKYNSISMTIHCIISDFIM